jgi:hypothetical protein
MEPLGGLEACRRAQRLHAPTGDRTEVLTAVSFFLYVI